MSKVNYLVNGIRLVGRVKFCEIIEKIYGSVEYMYDEKDTFVIFWYGDFYLYNETFDEWYLLSWGCMKKIEKN